ncbi:DUF535 family protein [Trinickia caryophylli]|uniref:DUF535 domain-containing protein n=1 Tax=Trinickia caryophylli TaxID=28094 RepID=A0A1X7GQ78_TRICW|nr:DUF535 family protein [Trinickia caryophylli]PMS10492.1 hypothetical protein C0Z17_19155 [Trinickia caryophylli]TRX19115.1 DUF535 domain-containing protein [Trinickia caryophylli]WQE13588.1 DUF535 family protein [Trinickia caryophylli]SMF72606.1 hypothetical protein SAMN06295900_11727 [Trinickia caryophylli]GLU35102.1 hypothetical protein Busp01_49440 [Trinickia caryophylli]
MTTLPSLIEPRSSQTPGTPRTSLQLIAQCAAKAYPGSTAFDWRRRARFVLRSAFEWKTTVPWLRFCAEPEAASAAHRCPSLLERMHRPFIHRGLTQRQKLSIAIDHYRFASAVVPRMVPEVGVMGATRIAGFATGADAWQVHIELLERFHKEGDWTMTVRNGAGDRIVSCTFSIARLAGKRSHPRLLIGCVQGPDRDMDGRQVFRVLTKQWHGLRPKQFIITLAQSFAHAIGARSILIVSNHGHIYSTWRYKLRKKRVRACYGATLCEDSRARMWNGWHVLPARARRQSEDLTTGGCSRRKRRAQLIASLDLQILQAVYDAGGHRCAHR